MIPTDARISQTVFGMQNLLDEHEYFLSNLDIPLDALPCFDPSRAVPLFRLVLLFVYSLESIALMIWPSHLPKITDKIWIAVKMVNIILLYFRAVNYIRHIPWFSFITCFFIFDPAVGGRFLLSLSTTSGNSFWIRLLVDVCINSIRSLLKTSLFLSTNPSTLYSTTPIE